MTGLSQFDLSEKELENLRSRRWNFSSSTTKVSDLSRGGSDKEEEQSADSGRNGSSNGLQVISPKNLLSSSPSDAKSAKTPSSKETLGEALKRLKRSITPESLKNCKPNLRGNLHAIPESPIDSPLPLDSPLPFDESPLPLDTPSSPTPGNGSIMMKIPVIVTGSDVDSQNDSENGSVASSGESGDEADIEDSNDSEAQLSQSSTDIAAIQKSRKKDHPLHLSISIPSSNASSSSDIGGRLRLPVDSDGEGSYHSASVEKERTRLREEGEDDVGKSEKNALRILGMVRLTYCMHVRWAS